MMVVGCLPVTQVGAKLPLPYAEGVFVLQTRPYIWGGGKGLL